MKTVETYRWIYTERGRTRTTRFHCTAEQIHAESPDAVAVEGTLILRRDFETPEEAVQLASSGNGSTRVG